LALERGFALQELRDALNAFQDIIYLALTMIN
jgi:hypothetical protein